MPQKKQRADILAGFFNEILPHFAEPFVDAYADRPVIAQLVDIGNDQRQSVDFRLDQETGVRIYGIGEISAEDAFDYGWIEEKRTGRK